jgi:WD40 repeat protein
VRLWDLSQGTLLKTLSGHRSWVEAALFCANDSQALSTGQDSRLLRWDLETGEIASEVTQHGSLHALACSADATRVFSAGDDRGFTCWDLATGKLLGERRGHGRSVRALALSPDGTKLVTASEDTTLLVWDTSGM